MFFVRQDEGLTGVGLQDGGGDIEQARRALADALGR